MMVFVLKTIHHKIHDLNRTMKVETTGFTRCTGTHFTCISFMLPNKNTLNLSDDEISIFYENKYISLKRNKHVGFIRDRKF